MIRRLAGRAVLGLARFDLVTRQCRAPRAILIGAPHTSNWDAVVMLGIAWSLRLRPKVLIKKEYFRGWRKPIATLLGGIPVDRDNPAGLVEDLVARSQRGESFHLVITPEGTRGRGQYWKSGFYRIARQAGLPLVLGYVNAETRTTGLGPTIELTGDIRADMDTIREFYDGAVGLNPSQFTPPRLAAEDTTSDTAPRAEFGEQ